MRKYTKLNERCKVTYYEAMILYTHTHKKKMKKTNGNFLK